ncbi:TonB-dependent receptor [Pontibacter qinzhouensis]|uniref:TonB-dependent receptor n=1 Tax=Pontibacter qinzhouensis TaxID=2603253 RepID=A0A5C8KA91_9BACT|nr:TonB-dependent receptor [Pontibacter qinzhouensis]TXK47658.1 TonB-dependent receptor [Pontibacter qinzhouensis]
MLRFLAVWFVLLFPLGVAAQQALVSGTITGPDNQPLEFATVGLKGTSIARQTDAKGYYSLQVPTGQEVTIVIRFLGYKEREQAIQLLPGERRTLNMALELDNRQLKGVDVQGRRDANSREEVSMTKLDPKLIKELPSAFGDFNQILLTLPGVTSSNELSSTYSVRGGNYDENLIYVNGIEIYRPFLVTNAQQEGLSFVNPDLAGSLEFSSGGWQPKFGDKLSSVLNIEYKRPTAFAGSVTGSLTGGALHLESASKNKKVSYLLGLRHKDGRYILSGLQVEGQYQPTFSDAQAYVHIDLTKEGQQRERTTLGVLASYAQNNFTIEPESRETTFGTRQAPLRLFVGYDGRELMDYQTYQIGLNLAHAFTTSFLSEFIVSGVYSQEREFRDIEAGYRLCDVNTNRGANYGECLQQRGVGSQFDHARNTLLAQVLTFESRNKWQLGRRSNVVAGVKVGQERIDDKLSEYGFTDSADFVSPAYYLNTSLNLNTLRYNAYLQHTYQIDSLKTLTYGIRASYWELNRELTITPRVQYSFITRRNPNLSFKGAVGLYYQPPFYRELRNYEGELNLELKAQRSIHAIAGSDYLFKAWGRDFKLTSEVYYKYLTNVIPYDLDNVRLRYLAENNAKAYAAGFDVRVNGEFIKGAESWLSLGLMTTKENLQGDSTFVFDNAGNITGKTPRGYIPRPTNQLVNIGVFFQDHLPDNPTIRMNLNLLYASGLPFGPPRDLAYRNFFKGRSYKRVDIGFSKLIMLGDELTARNQVSLESLWIGLEFLNLIDARNRVSYSYVSDVNNLTYAVPNYLPGRRVNLRFIARF